MKENDLQKILTNDGSHSLYHKVLDETYHSRHGALNEAIHVFIQSGLECWKRNQPNKKKINLFEMGFGTGLNCLLTYQWATENGYEISYEGIEKYPLSPEEYQQLNYTELNGLTDLGSVFVDLHNATWNEWGTVTDHFKLKKSQADISTYTLAKGIDLIYFDAFGARVQPDLWTEKIFQKLFNAMNDGGILVTYSAKGSVKRALIACGFRVEKIPGPPGKREMLRAHKN